MAIKMMKNDCIERAKLLKMKAEKAFKAGDNANCKEYIEKAINIIEEQRNSFALRRKQI